MRLRSVERLATAAARALHTPADDPAWDAAEEALDRAAADPAAVAALLAAGLRQDDLDSQRFVEIDAALRDTAAGGDQARQATIAR